MTKIRKYYFSKKILKGFTLAELIVVVSILAILATIGFLALSGYSQDAKDSAVKTNVRSVYAAITAESAVTGNSARYYVAHDPAASLSGGIVIFDGVSTTLTWGDWNAPNTNYSAGNPDWVKLKLNPEKFRVSVARGKIIWTLWLWEAAYDPKLVTAWAADVGTVLSKSGIRRSASYLQIAGISLSSGVVSVTGNFPTNLTGSVTWLIKDSGSPSSTWALMDSVTVGGTAITYPNWSLDGGSWAYYVSAGEKGYPTSCLDILSNSGTYYVEWSPTALWNSFKDGKYWIDSDGIGGDEKYEAYCDFSTGSGWTYYPASYCRPMPETASCKTLHDNAYWSNANDFDQIPGALSYGSSYAWHANLKNVIMYVRNPAIKESVCVKMPNVDIDYNPTSAECAAYHQTFALDTDTVSNLELYKWTGNSDRCGPYLGAWYNTVFTLKRNGKPYGGAITSPNNGITGNVYKTYQYYWWWTTADSVGVCVPTNQTLW